MDRVAAVVRRDGVNGSTMMMMIVECAVSRSHHVGSYKRMHDTYNRSDIGTHSHPPTRPRQQQMRTTAMEITRITMHTTIIAMARPESEFVGSETQSKLY